MNDTRFVCLEGLGYFDFVSSLNDYDRPGDNMSLLFFRTSFSEETTLIPDFLLDLNDLSYDLSKGDTDGLF